MATRKSFVLRLPPDLHADLRGWAEQEMRSLNAQIEYVLRDAVRRRRGHDRDDPDQQRGEKPDRDGG